MEAERSLVIYLGNGDPWKTQVNFREYSLTVFILNVFPPWLISAYVVDIQKCSLSPWPSVQAVLLSVIGIVFIVKELDELWLVTRRGGYRKQKQQGKLQYYWNGLKTYFCSIENVFQFIFSMMMIFVTTLVFYEEVTVYKVSIAGVGVSLIGNYIILPYLLNINPRLKIFCSHSLALLSPGV